MHILAFILMFVIASIAYACKGDWSGMIAIAEVIGFIALLIVFGYAILHPVWLVVIIAIGILVVLFCNK